MIAYHILCHDNMAQVARQVEALYSAEDVFLVDINDAKPLNTRPLKKWLKKDNVHVNFDSNLGWGGAGIIRKTLKGAFSLLDLDSQWNYYVLLSGQCLPIKSNEKIKEKFAALNETRTNCIRGLPHDAVNIDELPVLNKYDEPRPWGDRGHTKLFALPGTVDPQCKMGARWRAEIVEVAHEETVYVRPCNDLLMRRREDFFSEYQFCAGANWVNLHRSLLEHMRDDRFTYELYEVLSTTLIPDESFFQTYVYNSPFKDTVCKDHLRLIARPSPNLAVRAFNIDDWEQIASSDALFARKFNSTADSKIIDKVLSERLMSQQIKLSA